MGCFLRFASQVWTPSRYSSPGLAALPPSLSVSLVVAALSAFSVAVRFLRPRRLLRSPPSPSTSPALPALAAVSAPSGASHQVPRRCPAARRIASGARRRSASHQAKISGGAASGSVRQNPQVATPPTPHLYLFPFLSSIPRRHPGSPSWPSAEEHALSCAHSVRCEWPMLVCLFAHCLSGELV